MSHYRSCWQLSSTVFCVCFNLLLTKCTSPNAQNTEAHDLSTLQTKDSKQLTTQYLLFLTCHCQDTQAKRNCFNLSSLLRLPINKAMGTNCNPDCLLGKREKNKHFPHTGRDFKNLHMDPFMISNSHHRARLKLVYNILAYQIRNLCGASGITSQ